MKNLLASLLILSIHTGLHSTAATGTTGLSKKVTLLAKKRARAKTDRAYTIIRQAIKVREKHYRDVKNYQCQAYVKEMRKRINAPPKVLGVSIKIQGPTDTSDNLSESVSELTIQRPDDVNETMIASKVSGKSNSYSHNRSGNLAQMDFYKNEIFIPEISEDPFVTPLAHNATVYYRYRLAGTFVEKGDTIYKIQCIPKAKSGPAFSGYIYLARSKWTLYKVDLLVTKKHPILTFTDSLTFNYTYATIHDSLSLPLSQRFDFNFGFLDNKATGYVIAVYSNYQVNISLPAHTFSDEVLNISRESNERTPEYWDSIRPTPLTAVEKEEYLYKDTVENKMDSKPFLDSIDRKENRPASLAFLLGYTYRISYYKLSILLAAPAFTVQYNTVEGWNVRLHAIITRQLENNKAIVLTPSMRYGFSNGRFEGTLKAQYIFNPFLHESFDVEGGRYVFQFNNSEPITELINTFNTLFLDQNYLKLYEDRFVRTHYQVEPLNGLTLNAGLNISNRYLLNNTSFEKAIHFKNRPFTSNDSITIGAIPFDNLETTDPTRHDERIDAIILDFSLAYRPNLKYMMGPDGKISLSSNWPEFTLTYRQAIPGIVGSQVNYNYLALLIQQTISIGLSGQTEYAFSTGVFPNHNFVGFMDYHHFNDNQTFFGLHYFIGFQLLDYYSASTDKAFLEAHLEHHFNGLLLDRMAKLSALRWQLVVGAHYLYTPDFRSYGELDVGVENILHAFRVDFVNGFGGLERYLWGFRVGIKFKEL